MDWAIFWTALGVVATLGSLILQGFSSLKTTLSEMNMRLNTLDQRLSRMEGSFEERGRWESRMVK